ncbi:hypothetical protein AURDEDRAFT_121774 [Auricularia subglabra TFB-10046 SS5]|nr:hypothetical protein AURDEDRAFT_121774 [Auricularia subglabra TFB-10046 SS5]
MSSFQEKAVDRTSDYNPTAYFQNPSPAIPPPQGPAPQPTAPGTAPAQAPHASPGAGLHAAEPASPKMLRHSADVVAVAAAAATSTEDVLPLKVPRPPARPSSVAASAQDGAVSTPPNASRTTPAHSRAPSRALGQSRETSVALAHSRPGSVGQAPGVLQMQPPTSRPPSGSFRGGNGQAQAATAGAQPTSRPLSGAQHGSNAPPFASSRPPSSTQHGSNAPPFAAAAAALRRPSTAQVASAGAQGHGLLPVPEALPMPSAASIPAAVWGDLSAHAKQWRKAIKVAPLSEAQLRGAYDLVDKLEDATTAQDVAVAQQQLSSLLPGCEIVLPAQINNAPRPQSHPLPPQPCDYPSPASGHYQNEVQQPWPLQHGPSMQAQWLRSPSAMFYPQDASQPHSLLMQADRQPYVFRAEQDDPHARLPHQIGVSAVAGGMQSQQQQLDHARGQHSDFAAVGPFSFADNHSRSMSALQPYGNMPPPVTFGTTGFAQHAYNSVNAHNGAYSDNLHARGTHRSPPVQHPFTAPSPPTSAFRDGASGPPSSALQLSPLGGVNPQQMTLVSGEGRSSGTIRMAAGPSVPRGSFSGYRGGGDDMFHVDDGDTPLGILEPDGAIDNRPRGPVANGARSLVKPPASQASAPAAANDTSRPLGRPAAAASPTHTQPRSQPAAAASTVRMEPAAAATSTSVDAPPPPPVQAPARSVAAPTKAGRVKQRGNAATVQSDNPEEDAAKQALRLPFPHTPRGNFKSRRRRDNEVVEELQETFFGQRRVIFALAKRLGEDPIALLREANMGTGFGKENLWNLFQQFYSIPPGDWDVRDQYDFGTLSSHDAWEEFQKNADHEHVLLRFGWTFAEPAAVKNVGQMDKLFFAVRDHLMEVQLHLSAVHGIQLSFLMAGQNSVTDGPFVCSEMAPNAQTFFDMFGAPLDVINRTYQNHVQHTADMNEIAGRVGIPVPRASLNLQRIPKLTDPALYKGWDLARIYNDNLTPWYEAANPQIVPVPKRTGECLFLVHQLINMKNELCLDNWPWWLPLPYSPGLNSDRGLQCYGTREANYLIQWLCMRDPTDPTRPHPLGPRLCFGGERTDPETPLPTIRTTPVNCESSAWHERVITYAVAKHNLITATGPELRAWRQLTGEIDKVYAFEHQGRDPRDKAAEDESAARSKARRRVISNALVDSDADATGDEENVMDIDEPVQPAAAAARRTRSQVAAAPPPPPVDSTPAALPQPPVMYDGHMPTSGPAEAYWLPSSGNAVEGFPGGVPDNFSVWTCAFAKKQKAGKWTGYKAALTKARKKTVARIALGQPAPPQRPINNGGVITVEVEEEEEEIEEALTNKRVRLENAQEGRGRGVTATPSRKTPAAAASAATSTPKRASAAAAASTSTPSRASAAAAGGTPQAARTPGRQITIDIPKSRGNTPAPPPAEKHFRSSMLDKPEGPVPEWLSRVPADLEPASIQTAYYRVGVAMKRRRPLPEEFCLVLEDLLDAWPVTEALPDDLWQLDQGPSAAAAAQAVKTRTRRDRNQVHSSTTGYDLSNISAVREVITIETSCSDTLRKMITIEGELLSCALEDDHHRQT